MFVVLLIVNSMEWGKPSSNGNGTCCKQFPSHVWRWSEKILKKYHSKREGRSADTPNACSVEFSSFWIVIMLCCCRREGRHRHHHMWVKHKTSDRQLLRWEELNFSLPNTDDRHRVSHCAHVKIFKEKNIQGKKDAICSPNVLVHETHPCLLKDSVWEMRSSPWATN